jgi:DNA-binding NarL/FixJ family response regulator
VLSQYVEQLYARELLADQAGAVGYLLKDRVFNDEAFTAAIRNVAAGGTVLDPEVVQKLMVRHSGTEPLTRLTPREHDVLALMAEGRSNAAIAQRLFITEKAVRQARRGYLRQAGPGALRRRQPPRPGRPGLPGVLNGC